MIGRKEEIRRLEDAYKSADAQFVVVYGRRRIGKTYLVKNVFGDRFIFSYAGAHKCSTKVQLQYFHLALQQYGLKRKAVPRTWLEAFTLLRLLVECAPEGRKVIFIDELPWLDSPRSGFVSAFEHFWNNWASAQRDLMLIVCGSATSWITKKILKNRGGLHNRTTMQLHLHPFTLAECTEYARSLGIDAAPDNILEGYMVMGGVPYYWSRLDPGKSMAQNINDLFLSENGELRYEYKQLYASIFDHPEKYIKVIEALASKKGGMKRDEIIKKTKIESSGKLSTIIEDLIQCGFIRKYCHTGKKLKEALYQLIDFYTFFYHQFVKDSYGTDDDLWLKLQVTSAYANWCGLAFERVCLMHLKQIKAALGISGIIANAYSWHTVADGVTPGAQIDLLIDRSDRVVSICEMKYAQGLYSLTKKEADKIAYRMEAYRRVQPANKGLQLVMITNHGMVPTSQPFRIHRQLTVADLFT